MSEEENLLTFGELRKKQKREDRENELQELEDDFLLRVSRYLSRKKQAEGENSREYSNAKRVLDTIISTREQKLLKKAQLAVKTDLNSSSLNMIPEEQEFFRDVKQSFKDHRETIEDTVENETAAAAGSHQTSSEDHGIEDESINEDTEHKNSMNRGDSSDMDQDTDSGSPETETPENNSEDTEEGYELVETTSSVPEFMGTDLEPYGPFDSGERAEIPEENAEILVNRGNAERVS